MRRGLCDIKLNEKSMDSYRTEIKLQYDSHKSP